MLAARTARRTGPGWRRGPVASSPALVFGMVRLAVVVADGISSVSAATGLEIFSAMVLAPSVSALGSLLASVAGLARSGSSDSPVLSPTGDAGLVWSRVCCAAWSAPCR